MPICKQRKHCKHCFISVDPVVPPVGLKDQPSLQILLERSHYLKDQSKSFRFVATNCWKMIATQWSRSVFCDLKSELLAYNTSPSPCHHDHNQLNAMKDSQVSRILTTINTSVKDFDSSKCPAVK